MAGSLAPGLSRPPGRHRLVGREVELVELLVEPAQGGRLDHLVDPLVADRLLLGEPRHRLAELLASLKVDEADREDLTLVLDAPRGYRAAAAEAETLVRIPGVEEVLVGLPLSQPADQHRYEHPHLLRLWGPAS